ATIAEGLELTPDGRDDIGGFPDGGTEHGGEELEILAHAEVGIEREAARHVAHARANGPEVAHDVQAEDVRGARVGENERDENAEERRLPRAVGTDEAEELGEDEDRKSTRLNSSH